MNQQFEQATQQFETDLGVKTEGQTDNQSSNNQNAQTQSQEQREIRDAIYELDKLTKFKFKGQDYTPKDLERAILRQQDYTQKTQKLSEERKAFEKSQKDNQKYWENLSFDLEHIRKNPNDASKFIQIYPQEFHKYLKDIFDNKQSSNQTQNQQQQQQVRQSAPDIELLTRLNTLEKSLNSQEIKKNEQEISLMLDKYSKKYPDAIHDLVLAKLWDKQLQMKDGERVSENDWNEIFKNVDAQVKSLVKSRYGELIKKQTEANARGRGDGAGGGTPGSAPKKPKSFSEATRMAIEDLTSKRE